jgi:hypothetical protein
MSNSAIHDEESPSPSLYSEQQQQREQNGHLNPHFPTADFELPEGGIGISRRRSTVQQQGGRPRPEFVLPDFPTPAKQGRPTLIRELSSGLTTPSTPYAQTPFTQTPVSTRPPSPTNPLIPVEYDENPPPRSPKHNREHGTINSWRGSAILMSTCGAQLMDNVFMTSVNMYPPPPPLTKKPTQTNKTIPGPPQQSNKNSTSPPQTSNG